MRSRDWRCTAHCSMCHMHFVCAALHVTGLGCGFNSILRRDCHLAVCGRWATHMEKRRAAAQVTCFSPRGLKHVTWAAARRFSMWVAHLPQTAKWQSRRRILLKPHPRPVTCNAAHTKCMWHMEQCAVHRQSRERMRDTCSPYTTWHVSQVPRHHSSAIFALVVFVR